MHVKGVKGVVTEGTLIGPLGTALCYSIETLEWLIVASNSPGAATQL
jgi:hypothetical protein